MRVVLDQRGTAIVEFAILLPVLISLLAGIFCFGLYFGAAHSVQQAPPMLLVTASRAKRWPSARRWSAASSTPMAHPIS